MYMEENSIKYLYGDATSPQGDGKKYIVHICNDIGGWGAGFVVALSRRWNSPENEYRKWHREQSYTDSNYSDCIFQLGNIQEVAVTDDISVINMIAQHNCSWMRDVNSKMIPPIRYGALERCLNKVADLAFKNNTSVHMPKIGAGLAGGNWNRIEKIIEKTLVDKGIDVTVYLFDK